MSSFPRLENCSHPCSFSKIGVTCRLVQGVGDIGDILLINLIRNSIAVLINNKIVSKSHSGLFIEGRNSVVYIESHCRKSYIFVEFCLWDP